MSIDMNRASSGVDLPEEVAAEVITKAEQASAAMQLATQISLPGNGVSVPLITGDPQADFVDEGEEKPVSKPNLDSRHLKGHTVAVIVPFSNQLKRDGERLYSAIVDRLPGALAQRFDGAVFGSNPYSEITGLSGAEATSIGTDTFAGLVEADASLADEGYTVSGWALAPQARRHLLSATDANDRPLFLNSAAEGAVPMLLGAPTYTSKAVYAAAGTDPVTAAQLGYAGDWSQAFYGVVEGVTISISDQASLTVDGQQINLWQRNMFAVRAEFEVGFAVGDLKAFRKLTA